MKDSKNNEIHQRVIVGLDIGHSKVKMGFTFSDEPEKRHHILFPTVTMGYFEASNDETREKNLQDTVLHPNGKKYLFGDSAYAQTKNDTFVGLEDDWIESPEHDVLILGAWKKLQDNLAELKVNPKEFIFGLGLPAQFFVRQREPLKDRFTALIAPLLKEGQKVYFTIKSQSELPLNCLALTEEGFLSTDYDLGKEGWGVIDVGHGTTDFALFFEQQFLHAHSASCGGGKIVHEKVKEDLTNIIPVGVNGVVEKVVEKKPFLHKQTVSDFSSYVDEAALKLQELVIENAKKVFKLHNPLLSGILVVGGGRDLVFNALKESGFTVKRLPKIDSRLVIMESLIRAGLFLAHTGKYKTQNNVYSIEAVKTAK